LSPEFSAESEEYVRAVNELEGLGIMPASMPSLEPMQRALARSGLLPRIHAERNIIIAGTNGKGTTAATLSRLLLSAGQRVGLYTSPHLVTTRERIRIDDEDLSEEDFTRAYRAVQGIVREERLTHFEALTLIAAHVLHSGDFGPPVEWAIWEVGLGGMFDATNAIPHSSVAITRLGLDHQSILGNSIEEIARQKFGVIGREAAVVHFPYEDSLSDLRGEIERETRCRWVPARLPEYEGAETAWGKAPLSILGDRAKENTAVALTLFEVLGFEVRAHLGALAQVRWPGRFSRLEWPGMPCPLYVSGDHNPQGIESLLRILETRKWETLHCIVGIGQDKDAEGMFEALSRLARIKFYLTETSFKPLTLEKYPVDITRRATAQDKDPTALLDRVAGVARPGDLVVVTGSLYLVGTLLKSRQVSSP
jgi:dihydrofolate synthase/folylpolyglutamate synthase